jgi:hypothetical protein
MSSGNAVFSHSEKVYYRIGQKPEKKGWWRKNTGWFGQALVLLLSVGLLGFGWTARESFVASMSEQLESQITPQDTPLSTVQPIVPGVRQANNIVNMQSVVADWAKTHPSQKWSIVVRSIDGPMFDASYKPETPFASAEVYKLMLVQPLLTQLPVANHWRTTVTVDRTKKPVVRCLEAMLKTADDACATAIGSYVGWEKATNILKEAGYQRTDLANKGQPVTTTGDMAAYMQSLRGSMLDAKANKAVFTALQQRTNKQGLAQGCPGCVYSGMSGQNGGIIADAEIVQHAKGSYVLVVFSDGGTYEQLAKLSGKVHQRIIDETK